RARLAELDAFALDVADAEALAHECVDVDAAHEDVPPALGRRERDARLGFERLQRLGRDQREGRAGRRIAVRVEVAVALEALAVVDADALDRRRLLAVLGGDVDRLDAAGT